LLAAIYEEQRKLPAAKLALERGERLFPEDENILYYLGFLYDRMGDRAKGLATMEKLLALNPSNSNALNFVGYTLLESGHDMVRAADYIQRALALKPQDPFVLDSYGWLLYRQGKLGLAMKILERAANLKPTEGVIAEHLADVYAALKLPQKAMAMYEKALALAGADKEFQARVETKLKNLQSLLAAAEPEPRPIRAKRRPASR
jgi:tetratricopeptide (TPR) repeat protein